MQKSILLALTAILAEGASAQQLVSRADYNTFVAGGTSFTDDFEKYNIADNSGAITTFSTLNSATFDSNDGPGLVGTGASYTDTSGTGLQWNGNGFAGLSTKTIDAVGGTMDINYTSPVQAVGIDLNTYGTGAAQSFEVTVNNGGTQVGQYFGYLDGVHNVFFGWANTNGITSVEIHRTYGYPSAPIIDNSAYGNAAPVPEPASMAALALGGLGLIRRRRAVR